MKRGGAVFVALVAVLFTAAALFMAGEAWAGSIKLVSGGPDKPENKRKVIKTLIGAGGKLARCLRGHSGAVRIKLTVRRDGRTVRSTPEARSRAANCVASAIKRTRFGWTRTPWSAVVELSSGASADPSRRDMSTLGGDLAPVRQAINACSRRHRISGNVRFVFKIQPEGSLQQPRIEASRGLTAAARRCMLTVLAAGKVRSQASARPVTFRLSLSFANRGGARPVTQTRRPPDKSLQPQKFGPLAGGSIQTVMRAKLPKFQRCFSRHKRRGLKGDVVIRFTVRANGTVRNVKIRKTTLKHKRVESCMIAVGKTLKFPGKDGRATTRVFYPFRFGN